MEDLQLIYVKKYTENPSGTFTYELYYSDVPDAVWGYDWDNNVPAICDDLTPDSGFVKTIEKVELKYKLKTVQETSCFSMEHAINGIVALSWIDIERLESYPEEGRCVLHYGDTMEEVNNILKDIIV